jgi:signal transduction histidine kinase
MDNPPQDAKLSRLLSLSVHEFRSPISVVSGYLRMVLKDPTHTLDDRYRRMLEEAEKSCARLTMIVGEMSELSALEAGSASFKKAPIDIRTLLADAISALPPLADRTVDVQLTKGDGPAIVQGDAPRLKTAVMSILHGLRREIVNDDKLIVKEWFGPYREKPASWIAIAEGESIDVVSATETNALIPFDEWRGGCGLSLAVARRIIDGHNGSVWSAANVAKSAVIALPH